VGTKQEVLININGNICPICNKKLKRNLGKHIKRSHGEEAFKAAIIEAKKDGMQDAQIGERFGITFNQLEKIITEKYGINISSIRKKKVIRSFAPKEFHEERTTVWSFRSRGNWATHDGKYRGNWSPYIPRNVILKYTEPGDTVLDYFVGGGTTAIEAKLLGRKCIAIDINAAAVQLTKENLAFNKPPSFLEDKIYEPEVMVGDARNLLKIKDNSIDLICAHPPYAGIINYSSDIQGDLSQLGVNEFLSEMRKVARESFRVLKPGKKCAILVGDSRKNKHVVPIAFWTIDVFLEEGFQLKELVIKRQHNCKTTGFWYTRSIEYNFLLLAHEYLPIFEKPDRKKLVLSKISEKGGLRYSISSQKIKKIEESGIETTTVWIFGEKEMEKEVEYNLCERYLSNNKRMLKVKIDNEGKTISDRKGLKNELLYIFQDENIKSKKSLEKFIGTLKRVVIDATKYLEKLRYIAINIKDIRTGGYIYPTAMVLLKNLLDLQKVQVKEIIVVTNNNDKIDMWRNDESLNITHRYILIFTVINEIG